MISQTQASSVRCEPKSFGRIGSGCHYECHRHHRHVNISSEMFGYLEISSYQDKISDQFIFSSTGAVADLGAHLVLQQMFYGNMFTDTPLLDG